MPKIPSIPRISIVVPVGSSTRQFEDTLVSVLENRPAGCEILVSHDGNYDDPFKLDGEVRYVTDPSAATINLITAGAMAARGRTVHVLTPGFKAIEDWTEPAIETLDSGDVAVVAPVIEHETGQVVAAGWRDTPSRLCQAISNVQDASDLAGAYLQASFWRRDVLRSMADAFSARSVREASYAYGHLTAIAGWKSVLASECVIRTQMTVSQWDSSSFSRGRELKAVRAAIKKSEKRMSLLAGLIRTLGNPGSFSETLGQASYRGQMSSVKRRLRVKEVATYKVGSVVKMPQRQSFSTTARRAA